VDRFTRIAFRLLLLLLLLNCHFVVFRKTKSFSHPEKLKPQKQKLLLRVPAAAAEELNAVACHFTHKRANFPVVFKQFPSTGPFKRKLNESKKREMKFFYLKNELLLLAVI